MDINVLILGFAIGFSLPVAFFSLAVVASDRKVRSGAPKNPPQVPPPPNCKSSVTPPKPPPTRIIVEGCSKCVEGKCKNILYRR